jgi:pheromone shutdown protein TraB
MSDFAGDDGSPTVEAPEADAAGGRDAPGSDGAGDDGEGEVTLVGTAHVSEDSVREVEEAIEAERPDVVAVELDEGRYRQLQGETPDDLEAGDLLEGNTVFQFIAYWMLSYAQARLGDRFDIQPGADMMAAIDTAEAHGIDVALVDRDIQETIQRFWKRMSGVEKLRMAGALVFGITDPRIVGVMLGVVAGLVLGPLIGLFGGSVGVTDPVLARVTTGVVLAVVSGVVLDFVGDLTLDTEERFLLVVGGSVAVGAIGGVGLGLGVGPVSSTLGGFLTHAIGSLALGLLGGVVLGTAAGLAIEALGLLPEAEELDEEFDMSELTDADVVSVMMDEFREFSPGGAEALIDERDAYIAHQLVALRRAGHHVVAVVGAGHREGIERYLADPGSLPDIDSITGRAKSRGVPWMKIVGLVFSLGFLAFFVLLAMAGVRDDFLLRLFGAWFLINGVFAFALAKLAGARWSSAGVGGAVAWMTSVNPLLAPGWFTGYMELRHTTVNVADIGTLNDLLTDEERPINDIVSEMFDVPLFRLIMVVAATNIGSIIASALFAAYVLPVFAADIGGVGAVADLMVQGAVNSAELVWGVVA